MQPRQRANPLFMSNDTTLSTSTSGPLGEISQAPPGLEVFLDKHQTKLIVLAVVLALCAIGYVVYSGLKEGAEKDAGALLSKAEDISDLQSVVKNSEGTAAALSATVLLAEKQWDDGQQDDAISTLRSLIEKGGDHPSLPSAKASLAAKLGSQGNTDEASKLFRELTDDTDARHLAPYAWISLGDIALAKGDADAAEKAYETVERDFPSTTFSQDAMQRRLLLKAKAPKEIAAPISVPDVKLGDDKEGATAPDAGVEDLIKAIKDGASDPSGNPLLPKEDTSVPAE